MDFVCEPSFFNEKINSYRCQNIKIKLARNQKKLLYKKILMIYIRLYVKIIFIKMTFYE